MAIKTASGSGLSNSLSSGLVLLNTTSFSAVSAASVNNVFSSTYKNYRVAFSFTQATSAALRMRLRVSGADNTTNVYSTRYDVQQTDGATNTSVQDGATTSFALWQASGGVSFDGFMDIYNPNLTAVTRLNFGLVGLESGSNYSFLGGGAFTSTTVFDGLTIYPGSSTTTGSISVYGYNI